MGNSGHLRRSDTVGAEPDFSGSVRDSDAAEVLRRLVSEGRHDGSFEKLETAINRHAADIRREKHIGELEQAGETRADIKFAQLDLPPVTVAAIKTMHAEWLAWKKGNRARGDHSMKGILQLDELAELLDRNTAAAIVKLPSPKLYGVNGRGELLIGNGQKRLASELCGISYDEALQLAQSQGGDLLDEQELACFGVRLVEPGEGEGTWNWLKTSARKRRDELVGDEKRDWLKYAKAKVGKVEGYSFERDGLGDETYWSHGNNVKVKSEYADPDSARIGGKDAAAAHQLDLLSAPNAKELYKEIGARVVVRIPTDLPDAYRTKFGQSTAFSALHISRE